MNRAGWRFHAFISRTLNELKSGAPLVPAVPPRQLSKPVELAAMIGRLDRAKAAESKIAAEGQKMDEVLSSIEERTAQIAGHRGDLEHYNNLLGAKIDGMVAGSNQPPEDAAGNGGGASPDGKQPEGDKPKDADGDGQGR